MLLADVRDQLYSDKYGGPALRWALSTGYLGLTRQLHRAEEALMVVESVSELVGDVLHDDLSLEDSGLKNPFAMRIIIRDAMQVLSPGVERSSCGRCRTCPAGRQPCSPPKPRSRKPGHAAHQRLPSTRRGRRCARCRFAINDYRDDIFDSFVRGRNQLIWTYLALAISTYVLLALGLLFGIPQAVATSGRAVLYLVASLIGLFNRLRIEASHTRKGVDVTYGLYIARLLAWSAAVRFGRRRRCST